ncbi:hypothetical protein F5Y08DRAFT_338571 [Xylaria arbuscula]|nr:hypothetical protein F5Y08DRAFT_338571 [Xylaria arbuscula]
MEREPPGQRGLERLLRWANVNWSAILHHILIGIIVAFVYLNFIVSAFSVVPAKYPTPDFQNKSATFYDVVGASVDATEAEISESYRAQMTKLGHAANADPAPPWQHVLHLTTRYKIAELEQAYNILTGWSRCHYDFEVLELGALGYIHCLWTNWDPYALPWVH